MNKKPLVFAHIGDLQQEKTALNTMIRDHDVLLVDPFPFVLIPNRKSKP